MPLTTQKSSRNPGSGRNFAGTPPAIIRVDTKELMEPSKQAGPPPTPPTPSLDDISPQLSRKRNYEMPALVHPAKRAKLQAPLKVSQTNRQIGTYELDLKRNVVEFYPENPYRVKASE